MEEIRLFKQFEAEKSLSLDDDDNEVKTTEECLTKKQLKKLRRKKRAEELEKEKRIEENDQSDEEVVTTKIEKNATKKNTKAEESSANKQVKKEVKKDQKKKQADKEKKKLENKTVVKEQEESLNKTSDTEDDGDIDFGAAAFVQSVLHKASKEKKEVAQKPKGPQTVRNEPIKNVRKVSSSDVAIISSLYEHCRTM